MSRRILSKRIPSPEKRIFTSKTGVQVESAYCRKCMEMKPPSSFFVATDLYLDSNGLMSICKDCCNEIYRKYYLAEGSVEKAILQVCRLLNIRYDEKAIIAMNNDIESRKQDDQQVENIFGLYKGKLASVTNTSIKKKDITEDFTFIEPSSEVKEKIGVAYFKDREYFEESWGKGLTEEEYYYLENEFSKWKKTTKCDTQSEEILVREICYKQNEIRKARIAGKSVDNLVKSLQEIMKNSALTPALQNAASSGKSMETFGMWVKDIENLTPAEWYDQQEKFKDMDGLEEDREDIRRSIAAFITGSRDYTTTELEEINETDIFEEDTSFSTSSNNDFGNRSG